MAHTIFRIVPFFIYLLLAGRVTLAKIRSRRLCYGPYKYEPQILLSNHIVVSIPSIDSIFDLDKTYCRFSIDSA
jgi:hypothetical protein